MDNHSVRWIILISILCLTSFGCLWCFTVIASVITFCVGFISLLYVQQGDIQKFYKKCAGNPLSVKDISHGGLKRITMLLQSQEQLPKTDRRVTGSELIDSSLQEILGYIIRDYIIPWYNLISLNEEFPEVTIRKTTQNLAINISNRVKDIDWIPYLTTKLVDDAASHLRLFKQARLKLDNSNKFKLQQNSPGKEQKKKSIHKRNKSEADVTKCIGTKDSEKYVGNSKFYVPDQLKTLEDYFFELECQMEDDIICRDLVCMDNTREQEFLAELTELLLYILLPDEDFQCKALRTVLREIFCSYVILPLIGLISNPDFINQSIIWLCARDNYLPSEIFLSALRLTDNCDELKHTRDLVAKEIQLLRSRDSGGESDISIKQQLSSLFYVTKLIDNRLTKLLNCEGSESNQTLELSKLESIKKIQLPLDIILKNNVALSYFIDFVILTGKQSYLFFYLNIEGWKISVEQQLSDVHINKIKCANENTSAVYENIRTTALNIYDQYLGDKAQHKIQLKSILVQTLFFKIKNLTEPPSEIWFDDIQAAVYEMLQSQEEFLPAFHSSNSYLKLLEELDLIQQNAIEDDAISISSIDSTELNNLDKKSTLTSNNSNSSLPSLVKNSQDSTNYTNHSVRSTNSDNSFLTVDIHQKVGKHVRSFSDITDFGANSDKSVVTNSNSESSQIENGVIDVRKENHVEETKTDISKSGEFSLCVDIIETGIVSEKGKTFGVYAVHVSRQYDGGFLEEWHIYRRYSDFYDLHTKIKERYPDLSKIPFPGKKTFHNMERSVLERRMRMLGFYLQQLCQKQILSSHHALRNLLMTFLEQGDYDRATSGGPISHTIDTIVNPLKSGMKTIKNMPEQLFNTVDEVVEGLSKVFHTKSNRLPPEASKVGASLDIESDDNIPLRIMLLLMDEVFDLKSRNQWLRRRIITLLRQIVRTMFGDIVNRRILDYVSYITSPKNVAQYLHTFKHSFWPNGVKAEKALERDEATCYRTRIAAKTALLSWLSDELKHIIGSETTRRGLLTIFQLFQRPILNRRLLYVLLEGILTSLFPEKNMSNIFQKLYAKYRSAQSKFKECDSNKPT